MSDAWKRIQARIDTYTDELVRFQTELSAIPALGPDNGGQGEVDKSELIEKWLQSLKPDETFRIDAPDDRVACGYRPNLFALFKGDGKGRVWVLSHVDIVPPGELGLWDSDPYKVVRDGDYLIGRGVEDNQQGIVASYFAVKAFRDEGLVSGRDIGLIFVADEETGSEYGLEYILKEKPELFSPDDLIIVPDAGNEDGTMIEVAEKSMCWLRFTVKGKQCHASTPHQGINTMRAAAKAIVAIDEALHRKYDARDELYTIPTSTFEPTKKEANVPNVNTIPGEDIFYFDARVLPEYDLAEVQDFALKTAEKAIEGSGATITIEAMHQVQAPTPTPPDSPVVLALKEAVAEVHGRQAKPMGVGGGTVAAVFRQSDLPAAVWATLGHYAHSPNERAKISNMLSDAKVMAHVFMGK